MRSRVAFLLGAVAGVVVVPVAVSVYFAAGIAPAATDAPPMPFEKTFAHAALKARIEREMPTGAVPDVTAPRLLDGADVYVQQCAVCHGALDGKKTEIAAGMYPPPPQLFVHGVDDDPPGETYWKVANGIRLTGMPGFHTTLTATQLWNVTMLLSKKPDELPDAAKNALRTVHR